MEGGGEVANLIIKLKVIVLINRYIEIHLSLKIPLGSGPQPQPLLDLRTIYLIILNLLIFKKILLLLSLFICIILNTFFGNLFLFFGAN